MKTFASCASVVLLLLVCGCGTSYCWRPTVPEDARTVAVPTFRNESDVMEAGALATRQLLREFQREGTFAVRPSDDAALEIQGTVLSTTASTIAVNRRAGSRTASYACEAKVRVSVVDRRSRKVLVDNRTYVAEASVTCGQDVSTAFRDATGRLMEDLARQVVDDVLNLKF